MVYAPCHLLVIIVASLFLVFSTPVASSVLLCGGLIYSSTYVGDPGQSGSRTWAAFQEHCASVLSLAMCRWFVTVRVIRESRRPPAKGSRVVFGYHPHGLIPAGAAWFHHTPQWRAAYPQTRPVTMGASALFMAPILRDVCMWSGARTVSRASVTRALAEGHSIVLCPGGQAELVEHEEGDATVLCTHHKGFIKMAIEAGASVCPVFVFGEAQAQRNLLPWKSLQRWTVRKFGFPVPFVPTGYLGISPLPQPIPLTFVTGPVIATPRRKPGAGAVTNEEIDAVHEKFYKALVVRERTMLRLLRRLLAQAAQRCRTLSAVVEIRWSSSTRAAWCRAESAADFRTDRLLCNASPPPVPPARLPLSQGHFRAPQG